MFYACLQFFNLARTESSEKTIWISILAFLLTASSSHALQPYEKLRGRWQLEFGHYGFHTIGNYDDAGRHQPIPPSSLYQGFYGYSALSYDFTDFWSVGFFGDGAFTHSLSRANDRTSTYLNTGQVNTMLLWRNSVIWIAPEYQGVTPFFRNDLDTQNVLVGEGAIEHRGFLRFYKPWTKIAQSYAYVGYTYRDEGRSHLVPFGVGTRFRIRPIWIGMNVDSTRTAYYDDFTRTARVRHDVLRRVNASSFKFFSINPEYTRIELFTDWEIHRFLNLRFAANTTVEGRNNAQEYGWLASLTYTFGEHVEDPKFIQLMEKEEAESKKQKQRDRRFRMKKDKEDPTLFQETDGQQQP